MRRTIKYVNSDTIFLGFIYIIMFLICIIMLYPLILTLSNSVSDPQSIVRGEVKLLPVGFSFESYEKVFENEDIIRGFINSVIYTVVGTIVNLIMTILAAYPLSRKDLVGKNVIMLFITFTMFFSGGMIPTFLVVRNLHLMNTMWAIILPGAINTYNMIIARTYFINNIPQELQDAAMIDIVILTMFYAVSHWNAYLNPLMYFSKKEMYPLQVIIRDILQSAQAADMTNADTVLSTRFFEIERIKYASIVIASLPMVIAYPFIMKYFQKGVMMGAIKG